MGDHVFANIVELFLFPLARRCLCMMGLRDEAWPLSSVVD